MTFSLASNNYSDLLFYGLGVLLETCTVVKEATVATGSAVASSKPPLLQNKALMQNLFSFERILWSATGVKVSNKLW